MIHSLYIILTFTFLTPLYAQNNFDESCYDKRTSDYKLLESRPVNTPVSNNTLIASSKYQLKSNAGITLDIEISNGQVSAKDLNQKEVWNKVLSEDALNALGATQVKSFIEKYGIKIPPNCLKTSCLKQAFEDSGFDIALSSANITKSGKLQISYFIHESGLGASSQKAENTIAEFIAKADAIPDAPIVPRNGVIRISLDRPKEFCERAEAAIKKLESQNMDIDLKNHAQSIKREAIEYCTTKISREKTLNEQGPYRAQILLELNLTSGNIETQFVSENYFSSQIQTADFNAYTGKDGDIKTYSLAQKKWKTIKTDSGYSNLLPILDPRKNTVIAVTPSGDYDIINLSSKKVLASMRGPHAIFWGITDQGNLVFKVMNQTGDELSESFELFDSSFNRWGGIQFLSTDKLDNVSVQGNTIRFNLNRKPQIIDTAASFQTTQIITQIVQVDCNSKNKKRSNIDSTGAR